MNDGRYRLNVSARNGQPTAVTAWYETSDFVPNGNSITVLVSEHSTVRHDAAARRNREEAPFSKEKVKQLENRDTSDGSDGGACWSTFTHPTFPVFICADARARTVRIAGDHERVPGTKPGEKGSCRPKKKKAKKDDSPKKENSKD
jgi:hypothetical protein